MKSYQRTMFPQGQGPPPPPHCSSPHSVHFGGPPPPLQGQAPPKGRFTALPPLLKKSLVPHWASLSSRLPSRRTIQDLGRMLPCTPPAPFPLGFPSSLSSAGSTDLEVRDLGQCLALPITNRATLDKPFYLPTPQFLHIENAHRPACHVCTYQEDREPQGLKLDRCPLPTSASPLQGVQEAEEGGVREERSLLQGAVLFAPTKLTWGWRLR